VCDALLGASGLGDLGRLFPAGPTTPAGIDSAALLTEVRRRVEVAGWTVSSVDLTIVAARPRLGGHLDAMRSAIAALLGLQDDAVNVKASTGNLDASEGAGRTVSALAIASLEPRP
jgi:2-C-methyl-D-erythritol 2,4-cyclodiphosphate synthase